MILNFHSFAQNYYNNLKETFIAKLKKFLSMFYNYINLNATFFSDYFIINIYFC